MNEQKVTKLGNVVSMAIPALKSQGRKALQVGSQPGLQSPEPELEKEPFWREGFTGVAQLQSSWSTKRNAS